MTVFDSQHYLPNPENALRASVKHHYHQAKLIQDQIDKLPLYDWREQGRLMNLVEPHSDAIKELEKALHTCAPRGGPRQN
jgi:hypothetical protein